MSSTSTNDGWLSDDACREGVSNCCDGVSSREGVSKLKPVALALLNGREKLLNWGGRGNRVPPIEISELTEGDLWLCLPM